MGNTFGLPPSLPNFVGRTKELEWLSRQTSDRGYGHNFSPIVITGKAGIGKTSLVQVFLGTQDRKTSPFWFSASDLGSSHVGEALRDFTRSLDENRYNRDLWVVLDGVDHFTQEQLVDAVASVFNFKAVHSLILTRQHDPQLRRQRTLNLETLSAVEAQLLVGPELAQADLSGESIARVIQIANGEPLLLSLIRSLTKNISADELLRVLEGHLYDLADLPTAAEKKIITLAKPTIVSANEAMIEALKKHPEDIFKLSPRKYEELVQELLRDMGYDVELTPATRDGGKDILAYFKTEIGAFLCLVEAKRYRQDRKIGVELVRSLYGTLCDYQANNAMMVTTSAFSKDAREFQKKHQFQLSLRDYTDLTKWLQNYRNRKKVVL